MSLSHCAMAGLRSAIVAFPGHTHSCLLSEHTRDVRYELLFVSLYISISTFAHNTYLSTLIQVVQRDGMDQELQQYHLSSEQQ